MSCALSPNQFEGKKINKPKNALEEVVREGGDDRQVDNEGHGQRDPRIDREVLVGLLHLF